jgi:uncharacterized protein YbaP (TraB family)
MRSRLLIAATLLFAASAYGDPAAWEIAAGDATRVWLLGSVHYLREQDYPLPDIVETLYAQADALVMEIDLDDLDPAIVQTRFLQAAMLPPTELLSSVLDADVYADAAAAARGLGLDIASLEHFEPWLVALTLMDLGMAQLGFHADQGLEQHLLQRASRDGKAVRGLETLADQISVFDGLTPAEQQALLAQTLEEIRSPETDMDELLNAWRQGSLDALGGKLLESFTEFPRLYETLVVERNRRWISELERLTAEPGHFLVVVGALHLVGENSVIDLLRARGIDAVPLTPR